MNNLLKMSEIRYNPMTEEPEVKEMTSGYDLEDSEWQEGR